MEIVEWTNDELGVVLQRPFLFVSSGYMGIKLNLSDCYLFHHGESVKLRATVEGSFDFELNVTPHETLAMYETLGLSLPVVDG
ncbi:hypothetical protein [Enterovibrio calviensis]|uniref:hypothetical protein n=1 Tax=Enterovibrio calviensis TaxID=91359 RepID=UPI0037359F48